MLLINSGVMTVGAESVITLSLGLKGFDHTYKLFTCKIVINTMRFHQINVNVLTC